ncbi:O-antigen ligase family protein [uncultured Desulfuromusa sp.]|uniref:O-antigen ligase family protein n=1 Tax=uncultured Desulfuromusa sp. TaxID=219183 RepID=UPI002AA6AF38|nr:O-antigen ligase family protein [uncultured Desulfuromusa sp.]
MSITALMFLLIFFSLSLLGLLVDPIWGLCNYMFVYFISPNPNINWWAADLPELRWSLVAALILIVSLLLNRSQLSPVRISDTPVFTLLSLFLLLTVLMTFIAVDADRNYSRCYDLFRSLIVYYVVIKIVKSEKDFIKILILVVTCGALLGYFAYSTPRVGIRLEGVGPPDAADANSLAILFAGILPLVLPIFYYHLNILKLFSVAATALITNGIILTNSRGGLLATGVSITAGIFLVGDKKLKKRILFLVIMLVAAFLYLADTSFLERSKSIRTSIETDGGTGRFDIWKHGLEMAKDHPLGAGGGGFEYLSSQYMPPELLTRGGVRASHNTYLLILVEQGFLGLLLFLMILSKLFISLWNTRKFLLERRTYNDENHNVKQLIVVSLIVCLISYSIGAVVSEKIYFEYFVFLISLISVYSCNYAFLKT